MKNNLIHIAYLSIWTFTVIFVWVVVLLFLQSSKTQSPTEVQKAVSPLPTSFDRNALNEIDKRVRVPVNLSDPGVDFSGEETTNPQQSENDAIIISP